MLPNTHVSILINERKLHNWYLLIHSLANINWASVYHGLSSMLGCGKQSWARQTWTLQGNWWTKTKQILIQVVVIISVRSNEETIRKCSHIKESVSKVCPCTLQGKLIIVISLEVQHWQFENFINFMLYIFPLRLKKLRLIPTSLSMIYNEGMCVCVCACTWKYYTGIIKG